VLIPGSFIPGPRERPVPIAEIKPPVEGTKKKIRCRRWRVPGFWGLVVALRAMGSAFSAMSFP